MPDNKTDIAKLSEKKVSIKATCGDCFHYKAGPAAPSYSDRCSVLGVQAFAAPCKEFYPNVVAIAKTAPEVLVSLASVMSEFKASQLRTLSILINRGGDWLDRSGRKFGETVYFCTGQHYLSNYFKAFVVGASRNGEQVFLSSTMNGLQENSVFTTICKSSIVSEDQYKNIKAELIRTNKVIEPRRSLQRTSTMDVLTMSKSELAKRQKELESRPDSYAPPTLDNVPIGWIDSRRIRKLDPLVSDPEVRSSVDVVPPKSRRVTTKFVRQ